MAELRRYKCVLLDSVEAWKEFRQRDVDYFRDVEHLLGRSIEAIEKSVSGLKRAGQKVKYMMEELEQDYPQGVSYTASVHF